MDLREIYKYDLLYAKYDPQQLIESLYQIEDRLIADLYGTCILYLEGKRAVIKGEVFYMDSRPFKIYMDFNKVERCLSIMMLPLKPTRSEIVKDTIEINEIGVIRKVELSWPKSLRRKVRPLATLLHKHIYFAYISLETTFKTNFRPFGAFIFNRLYDILNIEISRQNKDYLLGKAFFNVTLKMRSRFRYFFDNERLQGLIEHFKANQVPEYSPIELIATLIVNDAKDTMDLLMDTSVDEFSHLPSQEFVSIEEDLRFWSAETLLLEYKELAAFTITKNDTIVFQVNCLREYERELVKIFKAVRGSLHTQFSNNIKNYLKHIGDLSKIGRPKVKSSKIRPIAESLVALGGKFTGSTIKEILQP